MKNSKKAFIDKIMLGFFLISFTTIFIGTVSDELQMRDKYQDLKKVTQTAVLSASKYYIQDNDTDNAEDIAKGIIEQTKLGSKISNDIEFIWDFDNEPNNVIATIPTYKQELFWFRLLGWNEVPIDDVSAKANILNQPLEEADDFVPIAVNGCEDPDKFVAGESFDFLYKTYDAFNANDGIAFYALSESGEGQSPFTDVKNLIDDFIKDKYILNHSMNINIDSISSVMSDGIENDVSMFASSFNFSKFVGRDMTIAVLDCESDKDNLAIKKLIPIQLNNLYCAEYCCSINVLNTFSFMCLNKLPFGSMMCSMLEMFGQITQDIFEQESFWTVGGEKNQCGTSNLFRINFEVLSNDKIILEY